ncbi:uncharacterized protein [Clytia hemisphaerica]|uniref:Uncharacterized protein n=1 Tax=Clytia hemisphaerica TaxID=252671 RepID=A0A7M5URU2_9CNID|eukprot:TCONS_00057785-protein
MAAKERDDILDDEKFQARNWKQYTERQLQKLHPVQRSRYLATAEINHLIYTQQTAIKAVRLQSLLPPIPTRIKFKDSLVKEQRMRVEVLMEDDLGLQTTRKLC